MKRGGSQTLSSLNIKRRLGLPQGWNDLAHCYYAIKLAGIAVKDFDFVSDAKFYAEIQSGSWKKALKIAQERLRAVSSAGASQVPFERDLSLRKDYSASLHKYLLTKKLPKATRSLVTTRLSHELNLAKKITRTPFDSDTHVESPFDS